MSLLVDLGGMMMMCSRFFRCLLFGYLHAHVCRAGGSGYRSLINQLYVCVCINVIY
jgi:hypothetical protein